MVSFELGPRMSGIDVHGKLIFSSWAKYLLLPVYTGLVLSATCTAVSSWDALTPVLLRRGHRSCSGDWRNGLGAGSAAFSRMLIHSFGDNHDPCLHHSILSLVNLEEKGDLEGRLAATTGPWGTLNHLSSHSRSGNRSILGNYSSD